MRKGFLASFLVLALVLPSCSSGVGTSVAPLGGDVKPASCPLLAAAPNDGCGGEGAGPTNFSFTTGGYISRAADSATVPDTASGSATTAAGAAVATFNGVASPSTGITTASVSMPSVSSSPIQLRYLDANYIGYGTTALPTGGTITVTQTGAVSATQTDAQGNVWTITGALLSDNQTVAVTFSSAAGTFTADLDSAAWTPQALADAFPSMAQRTVGHRDASTAGTIAVVAGCVAAGAGLVAAVAFVIPGGQGIAAVAGIVAAGAACVSAGAAAWDYFYPSTPASPSPTTKPN